MSATEVTALLALDASESACSVSLIHGTRSYARQSIQARKQAELLLPMVSDVLQEAGLEVGQITAIAVTQGPGAFTGVRIGCSIALALAYAWSVPLVPVYTLEALAFQALQDHSPQGYILAVLDARMAEVYAAVYRIDCSSDVALTQVLQPSLLAPAQVSELLRVHLAFNDHLTMVGSGLAYQDELMGSLQDRDLSVGAYADKPIHADAVASLGLQKLALNQTVDALDFEPIYLRKPV